MPEPKTVVKVQLSGKLDNRTEMRLNDFLLRMRLPNGRHTLPLTSKDGRYPVYFFEAESTDTVGEVIYLKENASEAYASYKRSLEEKHISIQKELSIHDTQSYKHQVLLLTLSSIEGELIRIKRLEDTSSEQSILQVEFRGRLGLMETNSLNQVLQSFFLMYSPEIEIIRISTN